jgi:heat shock protein HslJ
MNPIRAFAVVLLAAPLLVACSTMNANTPPPALDQTAWVLSSLPGRAPIAAVVPSLRFEGGRVAGSDGCNRIVGPFTADGGRLSFPPTMAVTRMACPEPVQQVATAFGQALAKTRAYRIDAGALVLVDDAGAVLATFAPQPSGLAGTAWQAVAVNNGREAVTGLVAGSRITLRFEPEGRARGSGGCNSYSAPYTLEGERLRFGPAITTRMACARPEGVMAQESAWLGALRTVATARREGDRLELRTESGALAATLVAADPSKP